jgi:HTH-type transcriptional regulator, sugar sensing transcriptional regulator
MIVQQELINRIKDYFGLNIYETKVWLALLGKGVASAGEIANISGVPRSRTYDVLESLEKKGFAIIRLEKPIKYLGVKPKLMIEKLKKDIRKEAEERMINISNIKETEEFEKLEELYKKGEFPIKRESVSTALRGRSNITNYLKEIINNAKKEVIICTNALEIREKKKLFSQTFDMLKKKSIKIKLVLSGNPDSIKQISEDFKMNIKKVDIESKFFIIDKKEILFYLSKSLDEETVAIWLNSDFFVQSFIELFEKASKNGR